ncbi:hypothetical protein NL108_001937 [Boleophthalmus pectinirostris]|nr:hypothetical protein NL108_001937 [Boleophthalmus pectinirostris]
MGEMSAILARRRKASNNPAPKKEEPQNDNDSAPKRFSGAEEAAEKPREKAATMPRPKPSSNRDSSPTTPSPSAAPPSRLKMTKRNSEDTGSTGFDVDRLKQEILEEVKKELHKVKEEIIAALTQQLQIAQNNSEDANFV